MDSTAAFYSRPTYVSGGGLPIFAGARRQRGGSIYGSVAKFFLPMLKSLSNRVMKRGAIEAVGLAKDVVGDAFMGKNVKNSVINRGKKRALDVTRYTADTGLDALEKMIGSGRRRRRRRTQRRTQHRQGLRKRKRSSKKSKKNQPRKKRRRTNNAIF